MKRILLLSLSVVVLFTSGCIEEDDITLKSETYVDGGIGTTIQKGSIEVRVHGISYGFVEVWLSRVNQVQRVGSGGFALYPELEPGFYTYTVDEFEWSSGSGVSVGVSSGFGFGGGAIAVGSSSYIGSVPGHHHQVFNGVAEIKANQLLVIELDL